MNKNTEYIFTTVKFHVNLSMKIWFDYKHFLKNNTVNKNQQTQITGWIKNHARHIHPKYIFSKQYALILHIHKLQGRVFGLTLCFQYYIRCSLLNSLN